LRRKVCKILRWIKQAYNRAQLKAAISITVSQYVRQCACLSN